MSTRALLVISMVILAAFLAISTAYAEKAVDSVNGAALLSNPAIVKDEIIIPMENGTMMEWRHIDLPGTSASDRHGSGENRPEGLRSNISKEIR